MGSASSSSTSPSITCTSYHGHQSVAEDEAVAEVSCHHADEVMTGCSSILKVGNRGRRNQPSLNRRRLLNCQTFSLLKAEIGQIVALHRFSKKKEEQKGRIFNVQVS